MSKYYIRLELTDGQWHSYDADNFIVLDYSKLEIIINGSVISYDLDLIKGLAIDNKEKDKWI